MSKRFIHSINYMRGLCMLGVIAIHVGSVAIVNPSPNLGLVAILEILSRFSVPAFFFLSAFGMFYSQPLDQPFVYKDYLRRRLRTVFVPYLAWSLFYMVYVSVISHNFSVFQPYAFFRTLWYGPGHVSHLLSGHPLVVLLPHAVVAAAPALHGQGAVLSFTILFFANMVFNFYSSYIWTVHSDNPLIQDAFNFRLNYVVLHYLFIFMFGAFTAEHFTAVTDWLKRHGTLVNVFQAATTAGMLAAYYGVMHYLGYDPYRRSSPFTSSAPSAWFIPCRRCSSSSTGGNAGLSRNGSTRSSPSWATTRIPSTCPSRLPQCLYGPGRPLAHLPAGRPHHRHLHHRHSLCRGLFLGRRRTQTAEMAQYLRQGEMTSYKKGLSHDDKPFKLLVASS